MANESRTNPLSDTVKNLRDMVAAREKLKEALAQLDQDTTRAEQKSAQEFASDVVKTGINREQAVQKFSAWKTENDRLNMQRSAILHFRDTLEKIIKEAKSNTPDDLAAVLQEEIVRLKQTYSKEKDEADTLGKRIKALEEELAGLIPKSEAAKLK